MTEKNKQAGMPSQEQALQFVKDWLWDSAKFGGDRKSESFDREQTWDAAQMIISFMKQNCPPPKSEAKSSCDYIFDKAAEIESNSEAEVEEEIKKLVKQKVNDHLVKHVDVEKGDTRCRVDIMCEQIAKELYRLLSAPSKGKYSEECKMRLLVTNEKLEFLIGICENKLTNDYVKETRAVIKGNDKFLEAPESSNTNTNPNKK